MAQPTQIDVSDLQFRRNHPEAFEDRFDEIQALRLEFYAEVFKKRRSIEEIKHFVGRLTRESWSEPNGGVGTTARSAQRRMNPQAVVAFDAETDAIKGLMYTAENVSSKYEPKLNKLHAPEKLAAWVGNKERQRKVEHNLQYVWTSEYAHSLSRADIAPVLAVLALETYDPMLRGSWWLWTEEQQLRDNIRGWGYSWNGAPPQTIEGENGFGVGSQPAVEQLWIVPSIGVALHRLEQSSAVEEAVVHARTTLNV